MYRKVVEAHRSLRADFQISEERCLAAEQRTEAAESKLAKCMCGAIARAEAAQGRLSKSFQGMADAGSPSNLLSAGSLCTSDADELSNVVSAASLLPGDTDNASNGPPSMWSTIPTLHPLAGDCINTSKGLSTGCPRACDTNNTSKVSSTVCPPVCNADTAHNKMQTAYSSGATAPPHIPSTSHINVTQRRLSFSNTDVATGPCTTPRKARRESVPTDGHVCKEVPMPVTTPTRPKQGFVIVSTPQSSSVRDRIRALERTPRSTARSPSVRDRVRALESVGHSD